MSPPTAAHLKRHRRLVLSTAGMGHAGATRRPVISAKAGNPPKYNPPKKTTSEESQRGRWHWNLNLHHALLRTGWKWPWHKWTPAHVLIPLGIQQEAARYSGYFKANWMSPVMCIMYRPHTTVMYVCIQVCDGSLRVAESTNQQLWLSPLFPPDKALSNLVPLHFLPAAINRHSLPANQHPKQARGTSAVRPNLWKPGL